jgi:hypothetical protein
MSESQKQFEVWALMQGLRVDRALSAAGADLKRYDFELTNAAFEIWQASRAAVVVELPLSFTCDCGYSVFDAEDIKESLTAVGVSYE